MNVTLALVNAALTFILCCVVLKVKIKNNDLEEEVFSLKQELKRAYGRREQDKK